MDPNILFKIILSLEGEKSQALLEELVELLDRYKAQKEAFYSAEMNHAQLLKLVKKYDIAIQQLLNDFIQKEATISDLKKREKEAINGTYDGVSFIEIKEYSQKKSAAISGSPCIYFDDFFTGPQGYKMCAQIYLNGDGSGKGTHLSIFLMLKKGPFDSILPFPLQGSVTFTLLNQDNKDPLRQTLALPEQSIPSSQRPTKEINILSACHKFVSHKVIEKFEEGFLRNDTIAITVKVDLS
ncbi:TNF receptor-associated factor 2 [Holothuria leucospilota]|uniref:TNF receptor-associated factor 2 n=1 Tax=Holothuria leucospilota TaxID=206669 RepID=A0A9Q1C372_HOLLE|nr:TNF receptor-associated factor 2 [Holothuria leucospilota]